mgnify:CR=1 FL=1
MEMEYHDTSRRSRLLIILGVVLAVTAGAAAFLLLSNGQGGQPQTSVQRVPVVEIGRAHV